MSKSLKAVEPKWLIVLVFFVAGIFLGGIVLYLWYGATNVNGYKIHSAGAEYKYINPLLAVEFEQNSLFGVSSSIDLKIQGVFDAAKKKGNIIDGSIYYRDIEPGTWAGVNENKTFSPGKLLKIPLMIAYFKLAEVNSGVLKDRIINTTEDKNNDYFPPADVPLVKGKSYTVEELVNQMIVHSDDAAANLLFDNINKNALNEVFSDLGINFIEDSGTTDFISLKLYSLFFRVLYNSTYLNRDYSEKALTLLDVDISKESVGISASVPKEILLVQRYGGRKYVEGGSVRYEMHDCGIIYYPEHPYLLCATAKGESISEIENFFKNVSKVVFAETEYKYKK